MVGMLGILSGVLGIFPLGWSAPGWYLGKSPLNLSWLGPSYPCSWSISVAPSQNTQRHTKHKTKHRAKITTGIGITTIGVIQRFASLTKEISLTRVACLHYPDAGVHYCFLGVGSSLSSSVRLGLSPLLLECLMSLPPLQCWTSPNPGLGPKCPGTSLWFSCFVVQPRH